ncbi:MAG: hypothetical protein ACO1N5_16785 [Noviherbaspirillum sp.]
MSFLTRSAVSALAPHVVDIVKGVLPLFTANNKANREAPHDASAQETIQLLNVQISELQQAALNQAEALKELAASSEQTIGELERRLQRQKILSAAALAIAIMALGLAILAFR